MFGGAVPDAMLAMIRLLATLHDEDGSVAVDGLTGGESETPEYPESRLRDEAALLDGVTPIGTGSILSRIWSKPAITVTGIDAPTVANASNTLSPTVSVRISARIAPGQTAADAFEQLERHLREPRAVRRAPRDRGRRSGQPVPGRHQRLGGRRGAQAMADAWGTPAVETGIGGSIPFIADLVQVFPAARSWSPAWRTPTPGRTARTSRCISACSGAPS